MSFEELVKKISPVLKRITYKLSRHLGHFSNDDLLQEALLHLWLDFQKGKLKDKTDSYILQGCYFHLKNYMRVNVEKVSLVRLSGLANDQGEEVDLDSILPLESGEPLFENLHCKMLVEQIMNNGLTLREKEVFALSLEGLTTREIGARIGVSHVMVVKLKSSMREKCYKHLDPK